MNPKVTVLMPVYNTGPYLREAMESILQQSYRDIELLIVNDGSTDNSDEIITSFNDERIKYIKLDLNIGIAAVRELGLQKASGEYIAFMDSDDISSHRRIEKQVEYMVQHQKIGACGTWMKFIDNQGMPLGESAITALDYSSIQPIMLFRMAVCNATCIIRKSFIQKFNLHYDKACISGEDYDFLSRCSLNFPIVSLPALLYACRIVNNSTSRNISRDLQYKLTSSTHHKLLKYIHIEATKNDLKTHANIAQNESLEKLEDLISARLWLIKILKQNQEYNVFDGAGLKMIIKKYFVILCINFKGSKYRALKEYIVSGLALNLGDIFTIFIEKLVLLRNIRFANKHN